MKTANETFVQLGMLFQQFHHGQTEDARITARDRIVAAIKQRDADARAEPLEVLREVAPYLDSILRDPRLDPVLTKDRLAALRPRIEALLADAPETKRTEPVDDCRKDLALLVRRLAAKCPDVKLQSRALDYLDRKGLTGSPLREPGAAGGSTGDRA